MSAGRRPRLPPRLVCAEQFNKLTERYFKASSWPAADSIGQFIEDGELPYAAFVFSSSVPRSLPRRFCHRRC